MSSITQDVKYRQSVAEYARKNGVTAAAKKYRETREFVNRWKNRYDGTIESLKYKSRRPKSNKNAHTPEEIQQVKNFLRRNPDIGLQDLWCKLKDRGYTRSLSGLHKLLQHLNITLEGQQKRKSKYVPQPYEPTTFPGEKLQIDVKVVPKECLKHIQPAGAKLYQYTALDEYTRMRFLEGFSEQSTYSSVIFLEHTVRFFKYHGVKIQTVQTDNGSEFTNRFTSKRGIPSLFERQLQELHISHRLIKPFTPRHNGKVERSHREDQKRFYAHTSFHSLQDFRTQLKRYQIQSNNRPMKPLNYLTPKLKLADFVRNS